MSKMETLFSREPPRGQKRRNPNPYPRMSPLYRRQSLHLEEDGRRSRKKIAKKR
jgi:hypothetical protein